MVKSKKNVIEIKFINFRFKFSHIFFSSVFILFMCCQWQHIFYFTWTNEKGRKKWKHQNFGTLFLFHQIQPSIFFACPFLFVFFFFFLYLDFMYHLLANLTLYSPAPSLIWCVGVKLLSSSTHTKAMFFFSFFSWDNKSNPFSTWIWTWIITNIHNLLNRNGNVLLYLGLGMQKV